MATFLQELAKELKKAGNYPDKIIVVPNKRSGIFLKKALVEAEQKVILAPQVFSIQSFINHLAPYRLTDSLELLFDFFLVYREKYGEKTHNFEEFMRWASPILTDFDDIDAYLADAREIFTYIHEVKKIEDWQLRPESPGMVTEYLQFYASLYDLYTGLQDKLKAKNSAYQGMNSRWVATHIDDWIDDFSEEQIVFAGFNALTKSEEVIIKKLIANNKATIYWDADKYYMKPGFEAGKFMLQNQRNFKDFKWIFDRFSKEKEIEIMGVPGKSTQAQVVSQKLAEIYHENKDKQINLTDTAVVLNETGLLLPLINSLPDGVDSLNITLGLPLSHLPVTGLFTALLKLFYEREQYGRFNVDTLTGLIHQTYLEQILSPEEQRANRELLDQLYQFKTKLISGKYWSEILEKSDSYLKRFFDGDFGVDDLLRIFFELIDFLSGKKLTELDSLALVKMEKLLHYLQDFNQKTREIKSIRTLQFLFQQLLFQERLSFEGEPLEGLQVMGLLETRLLDFKNLIITSVNEGILPKSHNDRSIIPFEIKKHFGLPMHYDKTAVTAYHFYRLLQRAEKITLLYNTDTEGMGAAEQSRFITQLENETDKKKHKIIKKQLVLPADITPEEKQEIKKNKFVIDRLTAKAESGFSASALKTYISNPLIFYKKHVLQLEEPEELEEAIPAYTMGNIIHNVMEELYKDQTGKLLSLEDFKPMLKSYEGLALKYFIRESFGDAVAVNEDLIEGKNLIAFEIIKKNIKEILQEDLKLVKDGAELEIVSTEEYLKVPLELKDRTVNIKGFIDRVDRLNGRLRIIDYKTGSVRLNDFKATEIAQIFENPKKAIVFQILMYAWLYHRADKLKTGDFPLQVGVISTRQIKQRVLPPVVLGSDTIDEKILIEYEKHLIRLIEEIFDEDIPFIETDNPY